MSTPSLLIVSTTRTTRTTSTSSTTQASTTHATPSARGASKTLHSEIWDTRKPKGIGFPYRWILERTAHGVRIRDLSTLQVQEAKLDMDSKSPLKMDLAGQILNIHPVRQNPKSWIGFHHALFSKPETALTLEDPAIFIKYLRNVFIGLSLLILLAFVMPKPKQEELIPPQFAKVIMTPPAAARSGDNRPSEASAKPVNVVQAFQSGAVKKSTQALLKASVASLLSKTSPFSLNKSNSSLQSLFNSKSSQKLGLTGNSLKPQDMAALNVGAIGGKGTSEAGVGYGNGEHAGVKGQGTLLVSLNTMDSVVDEGLTKDEVGKVIHAHISEVRYCYESAMIKNPDVQGKLVVNFVIKPMNGNPGFGMVKTTQINSSSLGDPTLDACIVNHLSQWRFPKPRGGVDVSVSYPFIFKSLGK